MKSAYLLLVEGAIIIDCGAARETWRGKRYEVKRLIYIENSRYRIPHCGMPCLKKKKKD